MRVARRRGRRGGARSAGAPTAVLHPVQRRPEEGQQDARSCRAARPPFPPDRNSALPRPAVRSTHTSASWGWGTRSWRTPGAAGEGGGGVGGGRWSEGEGSAPRGSIESTSQPREAPHPACSEAGTSTAAVVPEGATHPSPSRTSAHAGGTPLPQLAHAPRQRQPHEPACGTRHGRSGGSWCGSSCGADPWPAYPCRSSPAGMGGVRVG